MKTVVTGGAGFIGSHLADALVAAGHEVVVVDDLSSGDRDNIGPGREFVKANPVSDDMEELFSGKDCVFHLAAYPSVPGSIENPEWCHINGYHLTANVAEAARVAGVKRLVFASSCSVYKMDEHVVKSEISQLLPISPYAASKAAGELLLKSYALCYDMDCVSLRFFNVYGPRQSASSSYSGVVGRFCAMKHGGKPFEIQGTGDQSRDFVYVSDVVDACMLAGAYDGRLGGMVMNVGTGVKTSVMDIAKSLGGPVMYAPARPGDISAIQADTSRALGHLGFKAKVSLDEGVKKTMEWHASRS